jgi:nicotinate-nucleotide adenylyltransferase
MTNPLRRVALYGGSFNPPHIGHIAVVSYVLATAEVDAVWILPCPSHAFAKSLAPFEDRVALCEAAMGIFAPGRVLVSRFEAALPVPSRTVDTLAALRLAYPTTRFDLLIGTDILTERDKWKNWDAIEASTRLIIIGREGHPVPSGYTASPALVDVSSSEIRSRIGSERSAAELLPSAVRDYIDSHGLYR